MCFLSYFYQVKEVSDSFLLESVSFERHIQASIENFQNYESPLIQNEASIRIHTQRMENSDAKTFVDFANCQIHIGRVIPSLTQEEVLFSCCPELFIGILFTERLQDNEILVVRNVMRFSDYTGYMRSFRFVDFYDESGPQRCSNVIALDAVYQGHFQKDKLLRDVNKALLAFSASGTEKISTGHWGCGIFGGDETSKYLQQLVAASVAGVSVDYSTFRDEKRMHEFDAIKRAMFEQHVTIGHVFDLLSNYQSEMGKYENFQKYLFEKLKIAGIEPNNEVDEGSSDYMGCCLS